MRTCPYCDNTLSASNENCPACGAPYWDLDKEGSSDSKGPPEEEEHGCLSILVFHLLVASALTIFFVLFGFVINLLVHFEANQVKIIWLGASLLLGVLLSLLLKKFRRMGKENKRRY